MVVVLVVLAMLALLATPTLVVAEEEPVLVRPALLEDQADLVL
jgi:hypothetical protein